VERGVLDTSVVIDLDSIDVSVLPAKVAVTALTMAELAAGPHARTDCNEPKRRLRRYRSMLTRPGPMGGSTRQLQQQVARREERVRSI
jgi:predicted nucleic acid-binding protein